ncbi:hypothetical protein [Roseateles saccharophilus]|uniref:DUF2726 domain-containing protein n=1 Tax=Roseateles saccharophilus TaxID=304 RepID=A0A4R3V1W2_ROSSA|nr:hypothetical protein [Roseateles saccharophilus]MDG0835156.1 hypothetical protein [Roseateles saccharophilus]TCU98755.1 hypothetical protein EV671_100929 [Roseateles saccharophilus]
MLNLHLPRAVGAWLSRWTQPEAAHRPDPSDTVMHWPPTPVRVLASTERQAHKCLAQALALEHPKGYLLAHLPLHKLVRVPRQHSYREWLSRTGLLTVDFALCDEHGYVRSVVILPVPDDQPRLARRRERLLRVLAATELVITPWERGWQGEDGERLRATLFPMRRGPGYFADLPNAAH